MPELLSRITITCFAASYSVTLVLELSRLFFRAPVRLAVMLAFAIAGWLAHTAHLISELHKGWEIGLPMSRWYDWCMLAAWVLVGIYIVLSVRRPKTVVGLFLLPVVLILIALAGFFFGVDSFPEQKRAIWRLGVIHGIGLLSGTVVVMLGFVAGLMYMAQSYRLKQKRPVRQGLKLPSLEWLQAANRRALLLSTVFIAIGLVAGVVLNLVKHHVLWTDPLVWTSGILLLWLLAACLFEYFYRPARQGRKVASLTIASFVFLGLVLGTRLLPSASQHGQPSSGQQEAEEPAVSSRSRGGSR